MSRCLTAQSKFSPTFPATASSSSRERAPASRFRTWPCSSLSAARGARAYLPTDTRGKARVDDRRVISGIINVLRSGGRWIDARPEYGPRKTLYNRFVHWAARGVWVDLSHALAQARGPPSLDRQLGREGPSFGFGASHRQGQWQEVEGPRFYRACLRSAKEAYGARHPNHRYGQVKIGLANLTYNTKRAVSHTATRDGLIRPKAPSDKWQTAKDPRPPRSNPSNRLRDLRLAHPQPSTRKRCVFGGVHLRLALSLPTRKAFSC